VAVKPTQQAAVAIETVRQIALLPFKMVHSLNYVQSELTIPGHFSS